MTDEYDVKDDINDYDYSIDNDECVEEYEDDEDPDVLFNECKTKKLCNDDDDDDEDDDEEYAEDDEDDNTSYDDYYDDEVDLKSCCEEDDNIEDDEETEDLIVDDADVKVAESNDTVANVGRTQSSEHATVQKSFAYAPRLTKYEVARVLSVHAEHIQNGDSEHFVGRRTSSQIMTRADGNLNAAAVPLLVHRYRDSQALPVEMLHPPQLTPTTTTLNSYCRSHLPCYDDRFP